MHIYAWYIVHIAKGIWYPSYRKKRILKSTHVFAHLCKRNVGQIKEANETGCLQGVRKK